MPSFEVILRRSGLSDDPGERFSFDLAPGEEIIFGRSPDVDITIDHKKVSSRHGSIRCGQSGGLSARDLGSLNGTFLEGCAIGRETAADLYAGAQLKVTDFTLELVMAAQPEVGKASASAEDLMSLNDLLESSYNSSLGEDQAAREAAIQGAIEKATENHSAPERTALLEAALGPCEPIVIKGLSGASSGAPPAVTPSPSTAMEGDVPPTDTKPAQTPTTASSQAALSDLASRIMPGQQLETAEDQEAFCRLLEQVCNSSLGWLEKGLQSRGVFAEEFGAEVTLVFQRVTNPLKTMSFEQLRNYLLDWRSATAPETRGLHLEGVLKDLSEHQVGLVAGVREAVTSVIQRLSPQRIEALGGGGGWSKAGKHWDSYKAAHQEISAEQSKLFNEMISPAMQKGYLEQSEHDQDGDSPSSNTDS